MFIQSLSWQLCPEVVSCGSTLHSQPTRPIVHRASTPLPFSAFPLLAAWVSVYRCCCWCDDGGSGMRISNRGCRCGRRRRGCGAGSLPRSALVVAEPFAFGEAMAARPLWDRSRRDLLQRRPEAHLPGVCAERGPVSLAPSRAWGELQEHGRGWIQLEWERRGECMGRSVVFHGSIQMHQSVLRDCVS